MNIRKHVCMTIEEIVSLANDGEVVERTNEACPLVHHML
jgi:hypothetical protein